jgi:hypothetical protein
MCQAAGMVEMAGVEPASEGFCHSTSTDVVTTFILRQGSAVTQVILSPAMSPGGLS